jgi:hypothetical protein
MADPIPNPPGKSGAVTFVAGVNYLLGVLRLALGVLLLVVAFFLFEGAGEATRGALPQQPPGEAWGPLFVMLAGVGPVMAPLVLAGMGIFITLIALVFFLVSGLLFLAGAGLLRGRRWARQLTLGLAGLGGLLAVGYLIQLVGEILDPALSPHGMVISLVGLLVHGGYCALAFIVLLKRSHTAHFA